MMNALEKLATGVDRRMKKRKYLNIPIEDMEALAEMNKLADNLKTMERKKKESEEK